MGPCRHQLSKIIELNPFKLDVKFGTSSIIMGRGDFLRDHLKA